MTIPVMTSIPSWKKHRMRWPLAMRKWSKCTTPHTTRNKRLYKKTHTRSLTGTKKFSFAYRIFTMRTRRTAPHREYNHKHNNFCRHFEHIISLSQFSVHVPCPCLCLCVCVCVSVCVCSLSVCYYDLNDYVCPIAEKFVDVMSVMSVVYRHVSRQ